MLCPVLAGGLGPSAGPRLWIVVPGPRYPERCHACLPGPSDRCTEPRCWWAPPRSRAHHGVGGVAPLPLSLRGAHWPPASVGPCCPWVLECSQASSLPAVAAHVPPLPRQTVVPRVSGLPRLTASPSLVSLIFVLCSVRGFSNDLTCDFLLNPLILLSTSDVLLSAGVPVRYLSWIPSFLDTRGLSFLCLCFRVGYSRCLSANTCWIV